MMIGGIVGAIVLPLVSDKLRRRKAVLFVSAGIRWCRSRASCGPGGSPRF